MKFGIEYCFMTSRDDYGFRKRLFITKVMLCFKNPQGTTSFPNFTTIYRSCLCSSIVSSSKRSENDWGLSFAFFCRPHCFRRSSRHSPRSWRTLRIPFGFPTNSSPTKSCGWSHFRSFLWYTIDWMVPSGSSVGCITGCLPPEPKRTRRAMPKFGRIGYGIRDDGSIERK